jgi:hypothetical protein
MVMQGKETIVAVAGLAIGIVLAGVALAGVALAQAQALPESIAAPGEKAIVTLKGRRSMIASRTLRASWPGPSASLSPL